MLIAPVEVQSKDVPCSYFALSDAFLIIRVDQEMHFKVTFCL